MQEGTSEKPDSYSQLSGENLCFLCCNIVETPSELFQALGNNSELTTGTILSNLLNVEIKLGNIHSSVVCEKCKSLCSEYQEISNRQKSIQEEVNLNYSNTLIKLSTIESYDTEEQAEAEDRESNLGMEENHQQDADLNSVEDQLAELHEDENGQNDIVHFIQNKMSANSDMIPKMAIQVDDSQMSLLNEQYFDASDENMVEIIADDNTEYIYDNVIETTAISENDHHVYEDSNLDDSASILIEAANQSVTMDQNGVIIKTEIELGEEDEEDDTTPESSTSFFKTGDLYYCAYCASDSTVAYNVKTIVIHLKTEHNEKILLCELCDLEFRKRRDYNEHMYTHATHDTGEFKCDICGRLFENMRLLRVHKKMHIATPKVWSCVHCDKKYCSKNLLDEHLNMHTGSRPYRCSNCPKDFASKYTLSAHMKTHLERQRLFDCVHCGKGFYSQQNLIQHEKIHSGVKDYECVDCGKTFISQHNLDVHKIVHTGYKPFICRTCGKSFARRAEIKDHERTHTGERPFTCDICNASFAQRSNLQSHKRATHFNDKRHKCETCNRSFKRRRLLDYHIKASHTGERPYQCEICSATFVYPEHYKKHMKIHSGAKPYSCEVCDKTFNSRDNRNAHRFIHSDKKPYECMICGQGFMRKPLLYTHMQQRGHLNDTIVVNQPRITQTDFIQFEVTTNTISDVKQDHDDIIETEDYYIEERIEDDDDDDEENIDEEHLIVDGHVQEANGSHSSSTNEKTLQLLETDDLNDVTADQIIISEDGHYLQTPHGPIQLVKVRLPNSNGEESTTWVNLVSD